MLLPMQLNIEKEEKENVVVFIDFNVCGVPGNTFQYCVSFLTIHLKGWCCTAQNGAFIILSEIKCIKLIPNSSVGISLFGFLCELLVF